MDSVQPFIPSFGTNQVLTPAAAAATVNLSLADQQVRVINTGAAICYVRTSPSAAVVPATTADLPVAAGMATTFTKEATHDRLSHISATGTTIQVMTGIGG